MTSLQKMYFLSRLDHLNGFVFCTFMVGLIGLICYWYNKYNHYNDEYYGNSRKDRLKSRMFANAFEIKYKSVKYFLYFLVSFALLVKFLVPDKNEVIFIYTAANTLDFVQQDTSVAKIPYQTTKLITDYLDVKLKEISK